MTIALLAAALLAMQDTPPTGFDDRPPPPSAEAAPAEAAPPTIDPAFRIFLDGLRPRALASGVQAATFDAVVPTLTPNPRVIRLDRAQPGGTPGVTASAAALRFAPYRASHVDPFRITRGRSKYQALRPILAAYEQRTGVPEAVMLAIYGQETGYGSFSGRTDLLQSFATLAFDGRRRELFTAEFINTLKLIDRGIPRARLVGSWAGATGYPQFLPSAYLRLGTDGDGDGKVDIWSSEPDALASIGAYLLDAGWKPNVSWGVAVNVPPGLDRAAIQPRIASPRCPRVHARHSRWLTLAEWRRLGIAVVGAPAPANDELAALIEPDGPEATAYLLTSNYRSILDYNCSNFYALSVGLLAEEVRR